MTDISASHPAVRRTELVASLLDDAIRVPGTNIRIGLDPIVGLLPGVGDAASAAVSLYIVAEAYRAGVPKTTLVRMLANVGIDASVGAIPIVGDAFDAVWKGNRKNVELLKRSLEN
ncbi:DUF4112 domain-containing protein [Haloarchaeobius amylolyticus]|uniref:DUF4112 domain-containing protein n=1 Tax=Haloarchaeobius amylolyticus TaxID=1198296 RepID=UPI00226D7BBB|nr:DUF4112 domain-containing protein [Haloarchaeobius amylolyticus]